MIGEGYPRDLGHNQRNVLVELLDGGPANSVTTLAERLSIAFDHDGFTSAFYGRVTSAVRGLVQRGFIKRTWPDYSNSARSELTEAGKKVATAIKEAKVCSRELW